MEALEYLAQLIGRDADAAVADSRDERVALIVDRDRDVAPFRRILDRVLEQIAEDLLEAIAIAGDDPAEIRNADVEAAVADRGVMAMHDVAHELRPGNRVAANLEPSGLDARHIEQLEDQARHAIDLVERDVQVLLGGPEVAFLDQHLRGLRVALDRRDRRAQLMRRDR